MKKQAVPPQNNSEAIPIFLIVCAMIFYGISFPATRFLLQSYSPLTIVTLRLSISAVLLTALNLLVHKQKGIPAPKDFPWFLIMALLQPFLYFLCETIGLTTVTAAVSSIIIATIPVWTSIFSRVFLKEYLSKLQIFGICCSFVGVLCIITLTGSADASVSIRGILLLFGAVLSAVLYTLVVRKIPQKYSPLTITATQNTIGLLLFLPLSFSKGVYELTANPIHFKPLMSLLFLAVFASSLAFIFLNYGIQRLGASRANVFVNLVPVVTAVVSFLFFGELFSWTKIGGMLIVLAGVVITQQGGQQNPQQIVPESLIR